MKCIWSSLTMILLRHGLIGLLKNVSVLMSIGHFSLKWLQHVPGHRHFLVHAYQTCVWLFFMRTRRLPNHNWATWRRLGMQFWNWRPPSHMNHLLCPRQSQKRSKMGMPNNTSLATRQRHLILDQVHQQMKAKRKGQGALPQRQTQNPKQKNQRKIASRQR